VLPTENSFVINKWAYLQATKYLVWELKKNLKEHSNKKNKVSVCSFYQDEL